MTQRTEGPDLRRHLRELEDRVERIERRSAIRPTTLRPKPTFGLLDAKGDLIVASAADTAERFPVGANNLLLVPDSSTTTGLRWGLPVLPGVIVRRTTPLSVADATDTLIPWEASDADPLDMWQPTNPTFVTIRRGGRYMAWCNINWQSDGTGQRSLHLSLERGASGVLGVIVDDHRPSGGNGLLNKNSNQAFRIIDLAVGDRISASALQQTTIGGSLSVLADAEYSPYMGVQWVSDL